MPIQVVGNIKQKAATVGTLGDYANASVINAIGKKAAASAAAWCSGASYSVSFTYRMFLITNPYKSHSINHLMKLFVYMLRDSRTSTSKKCLGYDWGDECSILLINRAREWGTMLPFIFDTYSTIRYFLALIRTLNLYNCRQYGSGSLLIFLGKYDPFFSSPFASSVVRIVPVTG
jgi:hypothetical protein